LFGSTAVELHHWLVPLGIGLAVFLLVETEKTLFRRFGTARKPLIGTPGEISPAAL
jgi:hypothetical protein